MGRLGPNTKRSRRRWKGVVSYGALRGVPAEMGAGNREPRGAPCPRGKKPLPDMDGIALRHLRNRNRIDKHPARNTRIRIADTALFEGDTIASRITVCMVDGDQSQERIRDG